jgi:hypothetical protein
VVRVYDLDYVHRTYYFIADHPIRIQPGTLHVWRDDRAVATNISESPGLARLDPTSPDTSTQIRGYFTLLQQDQDYFIEYLWVTGGSLMQVPVLRLRLALGTIELLAVSYVDEAAQVHVGTLPQDYSAPDSALAKPSNCLLLKLIGAEVNRFRIDPWTGLFDPMDPFYSIVFYELRNLYDLGLRQIPQDRFQLKVKRIALGMPDDPDHVNGSPLVEILGLDQQSSSGGPQPDGLVDDAYIEYEQGLVFFPDLHPFAPDTSRAGWCEPGFGGFLCLDNLERNFLREGAGTANPHVYLESFPDHFTDVRYYLEATVAPPPDPGGVLHQNAPNPFNPGTRIDFDLNLPARARVAIYDIRGRLVDELLDRELPPGPHSVSWNGKGGTNPVASGVYYYVLETGGHRYTRRMVLAR